MISRHLTGNYADDLYSFLKQVECQDRVSGDLLPYYDNRTIMKVTIGVGFNIEDMSTWLRAVLKQFGLDPNDPTLTVAQRTAEQGWYDEIQRKITQVNYFSPDGNPDNDALRTDLDQIMLDRANDPALAGLDASRKRTFFGFNDGSEVRAVYDSRIGSYESTLDAWLRANGIDVTVPDLMQRDNKERLGEQGVRVIETETFATGKPVPSKSLLWRYIDTPVDASAVAVRRQAWV